MDTEDRKAVVTFYSHYDAAKARRNLRRKDIWCDLIPVPRSLSSSCGTALEMRASDFDGTDIGVEIEGAYALEDGKWSDLRHS